jgi:hypothetical protein
MGKQLRRSGEIVDITPDRLLLGLAESLKAVELGPE